MFEFSRNEIRDLLIAFVVLSICFAISNVGTDPFGIASILPIVMIGVGAGFLLHEIGHKFVSIKYGYWAEFKLWPLGLVIALVTAFLGFVFAAPGAVNTYADHMTDEINGRIAIAGPMTNMALALIFIAIAALTYPFSLHSQIIHLVYLTCAVGYSVNSYLAAFNLLPFATLDGTKVMKWNVLIWIVIFAIAAVMTLLSMTIGAENMVGLIIGM
ncbi:MAG: site-2 protease family protein [Methanobrevibacter sp.]|nr:site-2 protease family protein [Methanobrevibacter sp.]